MKEFAKEILPSIFSWFFSFWMVTWLLDDGTSFWLRFFLAGALSGGTYVQGQLAKLKDSISTVDTKANITDYEVVRISPLVDIHEDKINELERKIFELEDKLNDLELGRGRN